MNIKEVPLYSSIYHRTQNMKTISFLFLLHMTLAECLIQIASYSVGYINNIDDFWCYLVNFLCNSSLTWVNMQVTFYLTVSQKLITVQWHTYFVLPRVWDIREIKNPGQSDSFAILSEQPVGRKFTKHTTLDTGVKLHRDSPTKLSTWKWRGTGACPHKKWFSLYIDVNH